MPEFEKEEFTFPDEAAEKNKPEAKEPEFEIEIEDDTPAQDRGRQPDEDRQRHSDVVLWASQRHRRDLHSR